MKVLVTGGAGFIGSNLVKTLLANGEEVSIIDNFSSGFKNNLPPMSDVNFVQGDIRDSASVEKAVQGVNVIYILAASVGSKRSIEDPFADADINVMGTLNILEAARKYHVRKIIISSSAGIFGELKTLPIDEDHAVEPRTPYACSKLYAEKIALAYADLYDIEAVCLRYFNVYGPRQSFDAYGNVIPIFMFRMLRGEPLHVYGDGDQTRDFVNVHDVIQANIKPSYATGLSGFFNFAGGTHITINRLIAKLATVSGIKPAIELKPPRPGDVRDSLANISAAQKAFGYCPSIDLQNGLKEYFQWAESEVSTVVV